MARWVCVKLDYDGEPTGATRKFAKDREALSWASLSNKVENPFSRQAGGTVRWVPMPESLYEELLDGRPIGDILAQLKRTSSVGDILKGLPTHLEWSKRVL